MLVERHNNGALETVGVKPSAHSLLCELLLLEGETDVMNVMSRCRWTI